MKGKREKEILLHLSETEYITSLALADILNVSDRTIRNDLKELHEILLHNGAAIITKPKIGNLLKITNRKAYEAYVNENLQDDEVPSNSQERIKYILRYLLCVKRYVKLDDLSDMLFISKSSLSQDLKEVRTYLSAYNLTLSHKPNYGIRIEGREFDLRLCLASTELDNMANHPVNEMNNYEYLKNIGMVVRSCFDKAEFKMTEFAYQNLIIHIFVAIKRIHENCYVALDDAQLNELKQLSEFSLAEEIVRNIEQVFTLNFPCSEVGYIAIHLAAKKTVEVVDDDDKNMVITNEINEIVTHMLEEVNDAFHIDFSDDLDLRMMLALHLVPFKVRMAYDIILHNPILKEIKSQYTFAYNLAVAASNALNKYYHKEISEEEIGYFALHFNLSLERKKIQKRKKNILIVCSTGRGTAQLLVYKYREKFGKYLDKIYTCDAMSVGNQDFNDIDYVVATVPITTSVPVPIMEVSFFLEESDVQAFRTLLKKNTNTIMSKYFDKRLFLVDVDVETKEQALKYMIKKISEVKDDIPANFYQAVIKREKQAVTEFGNLVAIPHPYKAITKDTFVCIMILNKPIVWKQKKVQFIFMMSMETNVNHDLQQFYKITSRLLMNKNAVKELISTKSYDLLLTMFAQIEEQIEMED